MNINKLYTECQHGFRKHRSCITQLLEVMEDFTLMLDNRETTDVVYLEYKKAFDRVLHQRLLKKLGAYGLLKVFIMNQIIPGKADYRESEGEDRFEIIQQI